MSAPLPELTGEELLPESEPRQPGLLGWFCSVPSLPNPRTRWDVVNWWESRRLAYNWLVLQVGAPCYLIFITILFGSNAIALYKHGVTPNEFVAAPIAIVVVMNLCYTAGSAIELVLRGFGIRNRRFSPILAKSGLIFSRFVVTAPVVVAIIDWVFRLRSPGIRSIFDYGA